MLTLSVIKLAVYHIGVKALDNAHEQLRKSRFSSSGLAVSCIIFCLTFFGDRIAFAPAGDFTTNPFYVVIKVFVLLFLVGVVQLSMRLFRDYRHGNLLTIRFCRYFGAFFAILLTIWLLVYPGIIGVDEANVLYAARHLDFSMSWHYVLTNFCYAFALSVFPLWGVITFIELLFVCAISAYIAARVSMRYGNKWAWLISALLLTPQVVSDSVTPHRISFFAFVELLLIFLMWTYYQSPNRLQVRNLISVAVLTGIVAAWRTEAVAYLVAMPLCIWLLGVRRGVRVINVVIMTLIALVVYLPITVLQGQNTGLMRQYQVTGLLAPLDSILRGGDYVSKDKIYVKQVVDKAINYDQLVAGEDANTVYWSRSDRSISEADLAALKRVAIRLIIENPKPYLKGAFENYANSGMSSAVDPNKIVPHTDLRFSDGLIVSRPIGNAIHEASARLLRGTDVSGKHLTVIYYVFYANPLVGIIFLFTSGLLVVRRKIIAALFLTVIAKNTIVFLTMPMPSVYYLYPLALVGGILTLLTMMQYTNQISFHATRNSGEPS